MASQSAFCRRSRSSDDEADTIREAIPRFHFSRMSGFHRHLHLPIVRSIPARHRRFALFLVVASTLVWRVADQRRADDCLFIAPIGGNLVGADETARQP